MSFPPSHSLLAQPPFIITSLTSSPTSPTSSRTLTLENLLNVFKSNRNTTTIESSLGSLEFQINALNVNGHLKYKDDEENQHEAFDSSSSSLNPKKSQDRNRDQKEEGREGFDHEKDKRRFALPFVGFSTLPSPLSSSSYSSSPSSTSFFGIDRLENLENVCMFKERNRKRTLSLGERKSLEDFKFPSRSCYRLDEEGVQGIMKRYKEVGEEEEDGNEGENENENVVADTSISSNSKSRLSSSSTYSTIMIERRRNPLKGLDSNRICRIRRRRRNVNGGNGDSDK